MLKGCIGVRFRCATQPHSGRGARLLLTRARQNIDAVNSLLEEARREEERWRKKREHLEMELLSASREQARQAQGVRLVGTGSPAGSGASVRSGASQQGVAEPARGPLAARRKFKRKRSNKYSAQRAELKTMDLSSVPGLPVTPDMGFMGVGGSLTSDSGGSSDDECPTTGVFGTLAPGSNDAGPVPKPIFVVSDCTGESAAHTCRAALGQFEKGKGCSVRATILIFRFVNSKERLKGILERGQQEDALIVYTLVDVEMVKAVRNAAAALRVKTVDLWGNLLDQMEEHLDASRIGVPLAADGRRRKAELSPHYFKFIEAVEFTRKQDDGANPEGWSSADLLIIGVSRSGKTPLAIYLGQRGYRVANLPLVPEAPLPRQLFEVDQRRVVALVIEPAILAKIRTTRLAVMGVHDDAFDYGTHTKTMAEMAWARDLYDRNPQWMQLDVTLRSVEESAARILRMLSDTFGDEQPAW